MTEHPATVEHAISPLGDISSRNLLYLIGLLHFSIGNVLLVDTIKTTADFVRPGSWMFKKNPVWIRLRLHCVQYCLKIDTCFSRKSVQEANRTLLPAHSYCYYVAQYYMVFQHSTATATPSLPKSQTAPYSWTRPGVFFFNCEHVQDIGPHWNKFKFIGMHTLCYLRPQWKIVWHNPCACIMIRTQHVCCKPFPWLARIMLSAWRFFALCVIRLDIPIRQGYCVILPTP